FDLPLRRGDGCGGARRARRGRHSRAQPPGCPLTPPPAPPHHAAMAEDMLDRLEAVIRERLGGDPDASYVARLGARGRAKIAQKLGEEAVETVIAAMAGDKAALTGEAADLVFHLLVLLA